MMVKVIKNKSLPYEFQQIVNQLIWKGQKNRLTVCEFFTPENYTEILKGSFDAN